MAPFAEPVLVQAASASSGASLVAAQAVLMVSPSGVGNAVVVCVAARAASGQVATVVSVTDNQGNAYRALIPAQRISASTRNEQSLWASFFVPGGVLLTITATLTGGQTAQMCVTALEYSGLAIGLLDVSAQTTGATGIPDSGGVLTTQAADLLIGHVQLVQANTPPHTAAPWVERGRTGGNGNTQGVWDYLPNAVGTYDATALTGTAAWGAQIVALQFHQRTKTTHRVKATHRVAATHRGGGGVFLPPPPPAFALNAIPISIGTQVQAVSDEINAYFGAGAGKFYKATDYQTFQPSFLNLMYPDPAHPTTPCTPLILQPNFHIWESGYTIPPGNPGAPGTMPAQDKLKGINGRTAFVVDPTTVQWNSEKGDAQTIPTNEWLNQPTVITLVVNDAKPSASGGILSAGFTIRWSTDKLGQVPANYNAVIPFVAEAMIQGQGFETSPAGFVNFVSPLMTAYRALKPTIKIGVQISLTRGTINDCYQALNALVSLGNAGYVPDIIGIFVGNANNVPNLHTLMSGDRTGGVGLRPNGV